MTPGPKKITRINSFLYCVSFDFVAFRGEALDQVSLLLFNQQVLCIKSLLYLLESTLYTELLITAFDHTVTRLTQYPQRSTMMSVVMDSPESELNE